MFGKVLRVPPRARREMVGGLALLSLLRCQCSHDPHGKRRSLTDNAVRGSAFRRASLTKRNRRKPAFDRPANILRGIGARSRDIRGVLLAMRGRLDQGACGSLDHALRLAETIEAVSSKAMAAHAEDATTAVDLLEVLEEQLRKQVDQLLGA